ncbi:unnamed protein product [Parascedosporium putredinis]|uniref:Short-chain dehydrogenase n=1 Tax=Parascedosporium putredinis TaxID=1442378 RepID=A0A9P1H567_9PEZI|nr:unnamed protein product [Parascedosporium putredinis]CAI7997526.1 unnamed protein product [Parascedosporium putredinis]
MTSRAEFDIKTSGLLVASTYADRIKGKTILITGVSPNGIGSATAAAFASQAPALLLLASRTPANLSAVVADLQAAHPNLDVRPVTLDLSSQASVRAAAAEVARLTPKLDLLVNNAGLSAAARQDGTRPGETRVVNLASGAHAISPIRFSDYNIEKGADPDEGYLGIVAYGQSKTANILFTVSLQKELPKKGISAYCLHPGGVRTQLGRQQDDDMNAAIEKTASYWKDIDQGCSTTMVAALDPGLDEQSGLYLDNCQFTTPIPHATNPASADRLWSLSEELVGEKFSL